MLLGAFQEPANTTITYSGEHGLGRVKIIYEQIIWLGAGDLPSRIFSGKTTIVCCL